jgi:hypothetical protein
MSTIWSRYRDGIRGERQVGNRDVRVGGNVIGSAIVTGDRNLTEVQLRKVALPAAESVDIQAELQALDGLLRSLNTDNRQKITNALAEAMADAAKPQLDKDEIGRALSRALDYASKAVDFGDKTGKIASHVQSVVAWLGSNWHKLLPLVGLTI